MFDNKNNPKTSLNQLGEFGLIEVLTRDFELKNPLNYKRYWRRSRLY